MTSGDSGNRLDRIEAILERLAQRTDQFIEKTNQFIDKSDQFFEESDQRINSNAKAIESLTDEMQDFKRLTEQIIRRYDDRLEEITRDRAIAYQRITLLENNQSKLIDILRVLNRKIDREG